jgi:hypothetical protein
MLQPQKKQAKKALTGLALSKMSKNPIYQGVKTNAGGL